MQCIRGASGEGDMGEQPGLLTLHHRLCCRPCKRLAVPLSLLQEWRRFASHLKTILILSRHLSNTSITVDFTPPRVISSYHPIHPLIGAGTVQHSSLTCHSPFRRLPNPLHHDAAAGRFATLLHGAYIGSIP